MSVWVRTYPLWGRPRRVARTLLNMTGRALSVGCCMTCTNMTDWDCMQKILKWEVSVESPNTIDSLVWYSVCEFPSLCLGGWWSCWCMLACVGCWSCRDLGPVGSGNSVDCNELWSEGLKPCSSRKCVVSCCPTVVCSFLLVNLVTDRRDLGARGWGRYVLCRRKYANFTASFLLMVCVPNDWNSSYRCSLIYVQAAVLACSVTAELPHEAQTCIWTEGHAVEFNYRAVREVVAVV
jgi:hypothetical protein